MKIALVVMSLRWLQLTFPMLATGGVLKHSCVYTNKRFLRRYKVLSEAGQISSGNLSRVVRWYNSRLATYCPPAPNDHHKSRLAANIVLALRSGHMGLY